jgi:hypothetical protein
VVPYLIAEVFASNVGGTATLIGDPPNIIIASRGGLTFNDFLVHLAPVVLVLVAVLIGVCRWLFAAAFRADHDRIAEIMGLDERELTRANSLMGVTGRCSCTGGSGSPGTTTTSPTRLPGTPRRNPSCNATATGVIMLALALPLNASREGWSAGATRTSSVRRRTAGGRPATRAGVAGRAVDDRRVR